MKYLLLIILMCPDIIYAQATVASTTKAMTLAELITNCFFAVTSAIMIYLTNYAKEYLINKTKKANHERASAVIGDAFYSAIADGNVDIKVTLADPAAKKAFMDSWNAISVARLEDLANFKKTDMKTWAMVQQQIFLGKYLEGGK